MFRTFTNAARATLIACATLLPATVGHAASFNGAFWDADRSFGTIDDVLDYIDGRGPDATFLSTAIDYPNAGQDLRSSTLLSEFLGTTDAATLSGAGNSNLMTSVFRFTGTVNLVGETSISVGSDDGFTLNLNGVEVMQYSTPRPFARTTGSHTFTGPTTFDLVYYENYGNTGVEFMIGDTVVSGTMAAATAPAPVPLPAALPMLGAGIAAMAGLRRLRQS